VIDTHVNSSRIIICIRALHTNLGIFTSPTHVWATGPFGFLPVFIGILYGQRWRIRGATPRVIRNNKNKYRNDYLLRYIINNPWPRLKAGTRQLVPLSGNFNIRVLREGLHGYDTYVISSL